MADESTYACKISVVGRRDDGTEHFAGFYHSLIERTGGTVAMVGGASALISLHNASGWGAGTPVIIDADDVNKALKIKVKGLAGRNIRWVAVVEAVEVIYSD